MKLQLFVVFFLLMLLGCQSMELKNQKKKTKKLKWKKVANSSEFQTLVDTLWKLDTNRIEIGKVSYQGKVVKRRDNAKDDLFPVLNETVFDSPTYQALIALFDNYNRVQGQRERNTRQEKAEVTTFVNLMSESPLMKAVYAFLKKTGKTNLSAKRFRRKIRDIWFGGYSRRRNSKVKDSSGFEHVFIGEVSSNRKTVGGMHNWVRLYYEERKNKMNYHGYYAKKSKIPLLLTFRFKWYNAMKSIGGCFMGTSPEFEMALYTATFLYGYRQINANVNGLPMLIKCYSINQGRNVGTCYAKGIYIKGVKVKPSPPVKGVKVTPSPPSV